MNWKKLLLIAAVAGAFTFAFTAKSDAGVRVGIGIGLPIGYSCGYPGYYPVLCTAMVIPTAMRRITRRTDIARWFTAGRYIYNRPVVRTRPPPCDSAPPSLGEGAGQAGGSLEIGSFEESLELPNSRRVTHLAQRFRLNLADALARDPELPAHFFESAAVAIDRARSVVPAPGVRGQLTYRGHL